MKSPVVLIAVAASLACTTSPRDRYMRRSDVSPEIRSAIYQKRVVVGMDATQVRFAIGEPCDKKTISTTAGSQETWVYCYVCPKTAIAMDIVAHTKSDHACDGQKLITFESDLVVRAEQ